MARIAKKTNPSLWQRVKTKVTKSSKGGRPGQWSARKAQMATQEYKKQGGGYAGGKGKDNHLQHWQDEKWGTKSGRKSRDSGERYLPKRARERLSDAEYRRSTAKKRRDTAEGKQFSAQPEDVARKAAKSRASRGGHGRTKAELMKQARSRQIPGRSTMNKQQLERALSRH